MLRMLCLGVAVVMGVAAVANGLFMLGSPEHWYVSVPGVTTTGPFNQHFIRDIGLIFLFVGTAFLLGAATPHIASYYGPPQHCGWVLTPFSTSGRSRSGSVTRR